jgi:hypothetical protein
MIHFVTSKYIKRERVRPETTKRRENNEALIFLRGEGESLWQDLLQEQFVFKGHMREIAVD